jgi:hypothetical protein
MPTRTVTVVCPAWHSIASGYRPHRWSEIASGYRCIYCMVELTFREAETFADALQNYATEVILRTI